MKGQIITEAARDPSIFTISDKAEIAAREAFVPVGAAMICSLNDPKHRGSKPESMMLSSAAIAQLRSKVSGRFGVRLQSTGASASDETSFVLLHTLDVTPEKPLVVKFDQFIVDPFTGDGQFDLVERDVYRRVSDGVGVTGSPVVSSVEMGFEAEDEDGLIKVKQGSTVIGYFTILSVDGDEATLSGDLTLADDEIANDLTLELYRTEEETIATKAGFADGDTVGDWSRFAKVITTDKVYSVVFTPGDAGDGAFVLSVQSLLEEK